MYDAMGYSVPSPVGYSYANGMPNGMGYCYDMPAYGAGGQSVMYVVVDLAAVFDAWSLGMMRAYYLGAQGGGMKAEEQPQTATPTIETGGTCSSEDFAFCGVYDRSGYGVYDNSNALEKSAPYWDHGSVRKQEFNTYEEARNFAINGLSTQAHISVEIIPEMRYPINWREKVL